MLMTPQAQPKIRKPKFKKHRVRTTGPKGKEDGKPE